MGTTVPLQLHDPTFLPKCNLPNGQRQKWGTEAITKSILQKVAKQLENVYLPT